MSKLILKISLMVILFGISILIFGSGITTFLIDNSLGLMTSFANIFSGVSSGQTSIQNGTDFVFNLVKLIGTVLVYYLIAHFLSAVFVRKKVKKK